MKFITVLLCLALVQVVSSTVISLEEGDSDTKRIFKWILDPASPNFPHPRFPVQNGKDAPLKEFRFLATLDCSAVPSDEVAMAIYDPVIDDWNCTSTGNLPNDTSVPDGTLTGVPLNCTRNFVAVWNQSSTAWECSFREALLFQSESMIPDQFCRSEDLLTLNKDMSDIYINRPAGLCVASIQREVGPDAVVKLKRVAKNVGDPDEAFVVQTTSKAIGGLGSGSAAQEHWNWQYWAWTPVRTSFANSMGTYPPILAFDGMHLAAVSAQTYSFSSTGNVWTAASYAVNFRVVKVTNLITGTYPTITYMQYKADDFTGTIVAPATIVYTPGGGILSNTTLAKGNALSIKVVSLPAGLNGSPKSVWLTVSLWISHIMAEV